MLLQKESFHQICGPFTKRCSSPAYLCVYDSLFHSFGSKHNSEQPAVNSPGSACIYPSLLPNTYSINPGR